ncbi:NAD(P)/FAD-dependent oxidoreductase [Rhodovarius sp.]|uniref:dihydrolipoyl dehydrogenase family protein n=1 Tax=Rhodovarius sp. TaxID=2972673 RepID=UPI0034A3D5AB
MSRKPHLKNGILQADLCVIGAGSGGLSVAAGAAQMGAAVVLIEKHLMGGDCLNTGCVPSKALLAAAHAAKAQRSGGRFGVAPVEPRVDFTQVMAHVHGVIGAIAPHDSVARFEGLGCTIIQAPARFTGTGEVEAGGQRIAARRFIIATGSRAALPPIPGLAATPHLTNETLFGLRELPRHLAVIGGGPIGLEMAQAFRRLGSQVTVLERATILPKDEPEAVAVLRAALAAEGVRIIEGAAITRVDPGRIALADGTLEPSHILVAAGRQAVVDGLGLDAAGIAFTPQGITVDAALRTTNPRAFAIGDCAGGPQFTHIAGAHAGVVIRRALFGLPAKMDYRALPWVTYTDPELAHAGLTEAQAPGCKTLLQPFSGNDRAQAEGVSEGLIKLVLSPKGLILGATIIGPGAGEMISLWGLAIQQRMKIGAIAGVTFPYPTLAEIGRRAAGAWFTPALFGAKTRFFVGLTQRFLP